MKKHLTQVLAAFLAVLTLSADIYAEQVNYISADTIEKFHDIFTIDEDAGDFFYINSVVGVDGGSSERIYDLSCFTDEKNYIITLNLDVERYIEFLEYNGVENPHALLEKDVNYSYYFYLSNSTMYKYTFDASKQTAFTTKEILEKSGITKPELIFFGVIKYYDKPLISSYTLHECKNGWNTIDGNKYFVKLDGSLVTKSCKIGGVRYKFTADGVCQGRYTGWTKSDKGRRYWKNGELVTEKYLRTKSGKRYYADENGYVTEV